MKAVAVHPGQASSMHLEGFPIPHVNDIPNGKGVLVKVLRVGVDGTDKGHGRHRQRVASRLSDRRG